MAIVVVDLYSDGSGTIVGSPGGWAFVLRAVHPTTGVEHIREGSGGVASATNNQMELTAVIEGLKAIRRCSLVVVHSDSQYVIHAFTQGWIAKWDRRHWQKVKNAEFWHRLIAEADRHMVTWEWLKGHAGDKYNERCDELAGIARRSLLTAMPDTPNPALGQMKLAPNVD